MAKPKARTEEYIVDVCYGGCYALFPDGTVRQYRDEGECAAAIRSNARANKNEILVSRIEWRFREYTVVEAHNAT